MIVMPVLCREPACQTCQMAKLKTCSFPSKRLRLVAKRRLLIRMNQRKKLSDPDLAAMSAIKAEPATAIWFPDCRLTRQTLQQRTVNNRPVFLVGHKLTFAMRPTNDSFVPRCGVLPPAAPDQSRSLFVRLWDVSFYQNLPFIYQPPTQTTLALPAGISLGHLNAYRDRYPPLWATSQSIHACQTSPWRIYQPAVRLTHLRDSQTKKPNVPSIQL